MTLFDMQTLADLHYECYDAMLTLRLHREGLAKITRDMYEKEVERYVAAQRRIVAITNKYGVGSDMSNELVKAA